MHTPAKADYNTSRTEIPRRAFVTAAWCASSLIVSPRHGAGNNAIGFSQYLNNALTFFFSFSGVVGCSNCAIELRSAESHLASAVNGFVGHLDVNSDCSTSQQYRPLNHVFQLAHVARQSHDINWRSASVGMASIARLYGAPFFA